MGSVTYDFIANSIFSHERSIRDEFKNESESRLLKDLEDYRNHCLNNQERLIKEVQEIESSLKVFSSTEKVNFNLLKQTALYLDQFVICDPLFSRTARKGNASIVTGEYLGYNTDDEIDRMELASIATYLKKLTPMVAGNFVKLFPSSYHFEAPIEIPLFYPENNYENVLPKSILDFFKEHALVRSMKKSDGPNGGWSIEDHANPSRGIIIDFKGANMGAGGAYHLLEREVLDYNEDSGKVSFRFYLPENTPTREQFDVWVNQSINKSAKDIFDKAYVEVCIASSLNSTYLVDNVFSSKLLSKNIKEDKSISTFTMNQILNLELPFLDGIDIKKLMNIREQDHDIFINFRNELEKGFRDLRSEKDEKVLNEKIENVFHELNEVQAMKIKLKLEKVNKRIALNSALGIGGLIGSSLTGGASVLATICAIIKGTKDYVNDIADIRSNPSFLLWKTKTKK